MAAPAATLSINRVFITPANTLGFTPNQIGVNTGVIEAIGSGVVAEWAVADNVCYKNATSFSVGEDTWDVVEKENIMFKFTPV